MRGPRLKATGEARHERTASISGAFKDEPGLRRQIYTWDSVLGRSGFKSVLKKLCGFGETGTSRLPHPDSRGSDQVSGLCSVCRPLG